MLGSSLDRLAGSDDLDGFLVAVMRESAAALGGGDCQLFLFDGEGGLLRPGMGVAGGETLPAPGLAAGLPIEEPFPADITAAWPRVLAADGPVFFDLETEPEVFWPGTVGLHRSRGHAGSVCVALRVGGRPLGMIGYTVPGKAAFSPADLSLCGAMARQAALALHMQCLAAAAKARAVEAAVAREREGQAEEKAGQLQAANEALRRSVSRLVAEDSLPGFLHAVLLESAALAGARSNGIFLYDEATDTLRMAAFVYDGTVLDLANDPRLAPWRDPVPAGVTRAWEEMAVNRRILWIDNEAPLPEHWPQAIAWHREMGHRVIAALPLVIGDKALGFMAPCFADYVPPTEPRLLQCTAFAQQAAVALQLTRLAEGAQARAVEAAVAREREAAAEARAAELQRANDALRRSVSRLVGADGLKPFLDAVLLEAATLVGAMSNAVFVHDERDDTLAMAAFVVGGAVVDIATDPRAEPWRTPLPAGTTGAWLRLLEERQQFWFDPARPDGPHVERKWAGALDWHQAVGHRLVSVIPLVVGEEVLGFMAPCFAQPDPPGEGLLAQGVALAQQAALALRLTRLAREAQAQAVAAAVARERERAAEGRAAELAEANASLRRVNAALATGADLPALLGRILEEACAHAGASGGAAFALEPGGETLRLAGAFIAGRFMEEIPGYPYGPCRPMPAGGQGTLARLSALRRPLWVPLDGPDTDLLAPGTVEWHRARGHGAVVLAPLLLGDAVAGLLGLTFTCPGEPSPAALELVASLAQQATLALELTRLAEGASRAAVTEERNRLAREMHDTLAQGLAAILVHLRVLARERGALSPRAHGTLDTLEALARDNLLEARRSVAALRPRLLDGAALPAALRSLVGMARPLDGGPEVVLCIAPGVAALPEPVEDELLRIAQEAVANALRHAGATAIRVCLDALPGGGARLSVADDGRGFDAAEADRGHGLLGMLERAERAGATLDVASAPGAGTRVMVSWQPAAGPDPRP